MIARHAGAFLGLLAFTVVAVAGLFQRNSVSVTLSRSILALFLFCVLGLVLGHIAQLVVNEHVRSKEAEVRDRHRSKLRDAVDAGAPGEPAGTV